MDYKLLSFILQQQRSKLELLKSELARIVGSNPRLVSSWLDDTSTLPLSHTPKLLGALSLGAIRVRQPNMDGPILACLKKGRLDLKLSAHEVGTYVGVSPPTILSWESGAGRGPTMDYLERWAVFLGMGGIIASEPLDSHMPRPLAYENPPSKDSVRRLIETYEYEAHRYIPYDLEYAKNRVRAWRRGMRDENFIVPNTHTYLGVPLIHAKFRPLWTDCAVRTGNVSKGLALMLGTLESRRAQRAAQANTLDN